MNRSLLIIAALAAGYMHSNNTSGPVPSSRPPEPEPPPEPRREVVNQGAWRGDGVEAPLPKRTEARLRRKGVIR